MDLVVFPCSNIESLNSKPIWEKRTPLPDILGWLWFKFTTIFFGPPLFGTAPSTCSRNFWGQLGRCEAKVLSQMAGGAMFRRLRRHARWAVTNMVMATDHLEGKTIYKNKWSIANNSKMVLSCHALLWSRSQVSIFLSAEFVMQPHVEVIAIIRSERLKSSFHYMSCVSSDVCPYHPLLRCSNYVYSTWNRNSHTHK